MAKATEGMQRHSKTISELGPWFHNIHLLDGTQTAPNHPLGDFPSFKWDVIKDSIPEDLSGWTALDIGCNAGFYSVELARRGADVTGIDVDDRYLAQAGWVAGQVGLRNKLRFERMQVYDLARTSETYDLVLFMGVLYHLRYPMLGIDIVASKVKRLLVFQSLSMPGSDEDHPEPHDMPFHSRERMEDPRWPKMAFIEHKFFNDPTNWWAPNPAGMRAMLRAAGLRIVGSPEPETYFAEPDPKHPSAMTTWNEPERLSALGLPWQESWARLRG